MQSVENSVGTLGLLIKNSGDGAGDNDSSQGFHLHQEKQVFDTVKMKYRMQGASSSNTCDNDSWIPLNGPGFNGGHNGHTVTCPNNMTCVQGTPEELRDSSISVTYNTTELTSSQLLTFSGSGGGTDTVSTCSRDSLIPSTNPGTFFTELLVSDSDWIEVECKLPLNRSGYDVTNCETNGQTIPESQCSITL